MSTRSWTRDGETYRIVRFTRISCEGVKRQVTKTRLSLEQAQVHCQQENTHGDGWFDGYERED